MTEKPKQSNTLDTQVVIKERYHRDSLFSYYFVLLFGGLVIFLFLAFIGYIYQTNPTSKYFLTDKQDRLFQSYALDDKLYTDVEVMDWAAQSVVRFFDFNFLNYQFALNNNKNMFTEAGYQKAKLMLKKFIIDPYVVKFKYVSRLSLCDVTRIDESRTGLFTVNNQRKYIWTVEIPTYITLQNGNKPIKVVARIKAQVERVPDLDYLGGLAISNLVIEDPTIFGYRNRSNLPVCTNG